MRTSQVDLDIMMTSFEIANFWIIDLDRYKWAALLFQFLGLFLFLSVWWNQDRAWRAGRWCVLGYAVFTGIFRYLKWLIFGLFSPSPSDHIRGFIMMSGSLGLIFSILLMALIIVDYRKGLIRFEHFSPEDWRVNQPLPAQVFGLVVATFAIWSPFNPDPSGSCGSIFSFGVPSSFGVVIAPVFLFLAGLFLAGTRNPSKMPVLFLSIGTVILFVFSEPRSVHGLIFSALALIMAGLVWFGKNSNPPLKSE